MRLSARIEGDFREITRAEVRLGKRAVSLAMSGAGAAVKQGWRDQIGSAGFQGNIGGLQKAIRHEVYPKGRQSLNAATLVYAKGIKVQRMMAANEQGALIRSTDGFWLAIPTDKAGRGKGREKLTPGEWEKKNGRVLKFVYNGGRIAYLMDTGRKGFGNTMVKRKGVLQNTRSFNKKPVVMFTLVPQVKLRKRLNIYALGNQVAGTLPARVAALWRE